MRSRLSRGTLQSVKKGGMVCVLLPPDAQQRAARDATDMPGESSLTPRACACPPKACACPPKACACPLRRLLGRERGIACDTALKVRASSPGEGIALLSIVARSCYELLRLATAYFPETAREARKLLFDTVVWYYPKGLIGS